MVSRYKLIFEKNLKLESQIERQQSSLIKHEDLIKRDIDQKNRIKEKINSIVKK